LSAERDRIAVPTNGRGPHHGEDPASAPPAEGPAAAEPGTALFTPTQLAVGFGILASLVVLLVGRLRSGRRPGGRRPFGRS